MTKIMLVEDDKSLREIYDVRLRAEGYDIKYAGDGEEALAMAVKEHPDLIISDVMMPKISGFDMLDILRATPETKTIKVIMMTALSSDDQRTRGEALGADRYLVKSQVGIEDVVRTVHEVLGDVPGAQTTASNFSSSVEQSPVPEPTLQQPAPTPTQQPVATNNESNNLFTQAPAFTPTPVSEQPTAPAQPVTQAVDGNTQNFNQAPGFEVPQTTVQSDYAPHPVFEPTMPVAPVAPVADVTQQPQQIQTTQSIQATQARPTTIKVVDRNEYPAELPQPTAPFSTPAPASLGNNLMNPNQGIISDITPAPNNTDTVQNNGPIA